MKKILLFLKILLLKLNGVDITWTLKGKKINFFSSISNRGKSLIVRSINLRNNVRIKTTGNGIIEIGDGCFFNYNCIIVSRKKVIIGNNCIFGPNVCIFDHNHYFDKNGVGEGYRTEDITIGDNCWIGANVIVLKGVTIGDNCIIGAGTIVDTNIESGTLVTNQRSIHKELLK